MRGDLPLKLALVVQEATETWLRVAETQSRGQDRDAGANDVGSALERDVTTRSYDASDDIVHAIVVEESEEDGNSCLDRERVPGLRA